MSDDDQVILILERALKQIIEANILTSGIGMRERKSGSITKPILDSIKIRGLDSNGFLLYFSEDSIRPSVFGKRHGYGYLPVLWNEEVDVDQDGRHPNPDYGLRKIKGKDQKSDKYVYGNFTSFHNPNTRFNHPYYGWMEKSLKDFEEMYPGHVVTLHKSGAGGIKNTNT